MLPSVGVCASGCGSSTNTRAAKVRSGGVRPSNRASSAPRPGSMWSKEKVATVSPDRTRTSANDDRKAFEVQAGVFDLVAPAVDDDERDRHVAGPDDRRGNEVEDPGLY